MWHLSRPTRLGLSRAILSLAITFHLAQAGAGQQQLEVCYNFGCKTKGIVHITQAELNFLRSLFQQTASAPEERESIQLAIAAMERFAGRSLPTAQDVGGNFETGMTDNGQMDCIDESTNTTTYLNFLQQQGLLRWHAVEGRAFRAPLILDQHWTAQIRERQSGERFVVDSWFEDNGEPPLIQPLEDWLGKRLPSQ